MNGGYNILDCSDREIVVDVATQNSSGRIFYYQSDRNYNIIESMLNNDKPLFVKLKTKVTAQDEVMYNGTAIMFMSIIKDVSGGAVATAEVLFEQITFKVIIDRVIELESKYSYSIKLEVVI